MSAQSTSLLGYGLYFIDVLACQLMSIPLAQVGPPLGQERTGEVELPRMEASSGSGSDLTGAAVAIRGRGENVEIFLGEERIDLETLAERLTDAPPPRIVVRSEESTLTRVIAISHAAGVHDIQLAYRTDGRDTGGAGTDESGGEGTAGLGGRR